jgi:hypothetical protein
MSGWMPMPRNSLTECCVGGLDLARSPAAEPGSVDIARVGAAFLDAHLANRLEERRRLDVPTVPISMIPTSASAAD